MAIVQDNGHLSIQFVFVRAAPGMACRGSQPLVLDELDGFG